MFAHRLALAVVLAGIAFPALAGPFDHLRPKAPGWDTAVQVCPRPAPRGTCTTPITQECHYYVCIAGNWVRQHVILKRPAPARMSRWR